MLRRARSSSSTETNENNTSNELPDLLLNNKTNSKQPSQSDSNDSSSSSSDTQSTKKLVAVKEKNLSSKMTVKNIDIETENVEQIVDILESCHAFEPEQVQTVFVVDVDSEPEGSTPKLDRKFCGGGLDVDDDKQFENLLQSERDRIKEFMVKHKIHADDASRNGFSETEDSETMNENDASLRRDVLDMLCDDRNSFLEVSDTEEQYDEDEPLVFSEDEEVPRYSIEMDVDSDSDVVSI